MKKIYNIAVVGLGQVGIYLLNELNTKKKNIEIKTGTKINVVAISAKNIKRSLPKSIQHRGNSRGGSMSKCFVLKCLRMWVCSKNTHFPEEVYLSKFL